MDAVGVGAFKHRSIPAWWYAARCGFRISGSL